MERIKEIIVVEGKDDVAAVRRAVDAEIITTSGFGMNKQNMKRIAEAYKRCGIIILTDPDHAGERIREHLTKRFPNAKHCFLPKEEAMKGDNIGVENASPQSILEALSKVKTVVENPVNHFEKLDMIRNDLEGGSGSSERRNLVGKILGIGYGNAKQFLGRLNRYGITREEFDQAMAELAKSEAMASNKG